MAKTTKHYTIPIFVPELACPFQCIYCNQERISGYCHIPNENDVVQEVETYLSTIDYKNAHVDIGFFGGNFTGIAIEKQEMYLKSVRDYIQSGKVKGIRLSTRPDYIDEERLALLAKYGVKSIELGVQSMDPVVLQKSGRGHSIEDVYHAVDQLSTHNSQFTIGLQMMIGLPGDTYEKSIATAKKIIELGAEETRIYPTLVIRDTKLHHMYEQGNYEPLSLEEAVRWTKDIKKLFDEAGVKILRIGLHPSEGLLSGDELIAGPFHTSFKELVMTEIWWKRLGVWEIGSGGDWEFGSGGVWEFGSGGDWEFGSGGDWEIGSEKYGGISIEVLEDGTIVVHVPKGELNWAVGYKGMNKQRLKEKYKKDVVFREIQRRD